MADRYPLIVDSSTSTVKEIASGDNLNLSGNGVVNAGNIDASGVSVTNATVTGILTVGIGTSGTPAIVGGNNNEDGISFFADGRVNISVGGSEAMRITHVNAVGMNTAGIQTTVYQPVISIGDGNQDLSSFDSIDSERYLDDYPLLHLDNSFRSSKSVPGPSPKGGLYGFGPDPYVATASGRLQASLASAANIYQVVIPEAHIGHYYALCRRDVSGYRGLIDVLAGDAVGGATSTVRHGVFGHYGNQTGFTTMAKSVEGANGGDLGIRFANIDLQTVGLTTYSSLGLAVGWTTITGISTEKASLNITMIGYGAQPRTFFAGAFATTS